MSVDDAAGESPPAVDPDHPGLDVEAPPDGGDCFHVDVTDDVVREWYHPEGSDGTGDGDEATPYADFRAIEDYTPSVYVASRSDDGVLLDDLAADLREDPRTVAVEREEWRLRLDARDPSPVLRIDLERPSEIRSFVKSVRYDYERGEHPPGTFRLYNADFTPGFRYCLDRDVDPTPGEDLRTFRIQIAEQALANRDVSELRVDGDRLRGGEAAVLESVAARLRDVDPDVLVLSTADLVPLLHEKADDHGVDLQLGRLPGHRKLAGENTFESYGQVGHSPARYHVPGRAIVDTSNSFLLGNSTIAGLRFLVHRSRRPLQETAWGSIGTILTSIQTRLALDEREVLVPLQKRQRETYKDVRTLHEGDRGGFTFEPRVGLHEDVVELDFGSLYPRIISEYNVSPETVGCTCDDHDHETVPRLGYEVCTREGFLGQALEPLLFRRSLAKDRIAVAGIDAAEYNDRDATDVSDEEAVSNAIKWILVSCFGYQGYRNAKFGRIECHEAINAYARDILLDAKQTLRDAGWDVVHGIVDSVWVRACRDDPEPIREVASRIEADIDIPFEFEAAYDWVTFHPRTGAEGGALNRYVGKKKDQDAFKYRGVECRQRSTPTFVSDAQKDFVRALDDHREPGPVCDVLADRLAELNRGDVDPADLVVRQRVTKPLAEYSRRTHNVAALARSDRLGVPKHPGQDVTFVVTDPDASKRGCVTLAFEDPQTYAPEYYERRLVRACRSIVSPLGWDEDRICRYLQDGRDSTLDRWT